MKKNLLKILDQSLSGLHAIITFVPYVLLISFLTLAISARLSLGHWRVVYRDSFQYGAIPVLESITILKAFLVFVSPVVWIITGTILIQPGKREALKSRAIIYLLGLVVLLALNWSDPTGFFEWFWD